MAELFGAVASGVTLAGLFRACLEAFDMIRTAHDQEMDLKKLTLKLNIEKCRLYLWGDEMGLTAAAGVGHPRPLEFCPKISVLFVCFGNICKLLGLFRQSWFPGNIILIGRSPMAEGVFRSMTELNPRIGNVNSAGISAPLTGDPTDSRTIETLRRHGIQNYDHRARMVTAADFQHYDYILAVNAHILQELQMLEQQLKSDGSISTAKLMLFGRFNSRATAEQIRDPYAGPAQKFEEVYEQVARFSRVFLQEVVDKDGSPHFQDLVRDTLAMIIELFTDTQKLKDRYGCAEATPANAHDLPIRGTTNFRPIENLAASFSHYKVGSTPHKKVKDFSLKTKWVVHDRKKFVSLVAEVKDFIDGLQDITKSLSTVVHQKNKMRHHMQRINDEETLNLVTEVCEVDHPGISDAASEKSEILSLATTCKHKIEQWKSEVDVEIDPAMSDIESLTMTELKHRLLNYIHGHIPMGTAVADHQESQGSLPQDRSEQVTETHTKTSEAHQGPAPEVESVSLQQPSNRSQRSSNAGTESGAAVSVATEDVGAEPWASGTGHKQGENQPRKAATRPGIEMGDISRIPVNAHEASTEKRKAPPKQDQSPAVRVQEYWLPGYGLSRHVVLGHLQYFLGPSAKVRPYSYQVSGPALLDRTQTYSANHRVEKVI